MRRIVAMGYAVRMWLVVEWLRDQNWKFSGLKPCMRCVVVDKAVRIHRQAVAQGDLIRQ